MSPLELEETLREGEILSIDGNWDRRIDRRSFLGITGLSAAALGLGSREALAQQGPGGGSGGGLGGSADYGPLEEEGRLRFIKEDAPVDGRPRELRRLVGEAAHGGRTIWVNFDWESSIDLDTALRQQQALSELVEEGGVVVKTCVLEGVLDEWPSPTQRKVQVLHSGTLWLSQAGLSMSWVVPVASNRPSGPSSGGRPSVGGE